MVRVRVRVRVRADPSSGQCHTIMKACIALLYACISVVYVMIMTFLNCTAANIHESFNDVADKARESITGGFDGSDKNNRDRGLHEDNDIETVILHRMALLKEIGESQGPPLCRRDHVIHLENKPYGRSANHFVALVHSLWLE